MDELREALEKNIYLKNDLISHPYIGEELIGVLRSIESTIPTDCRNNFYNNLEMLRIISGNSSYCSLDAPVISLDEKLLWLADNNKTSNNTNFKDVLLEELYHELLHLASTSYVVDFESNKVNGYSGFILNSIDLESSNNLFNGLTEGLTQYLTLTNTGLNNSNYTVQMNSIKQLIDVVGIDEVKKCYFNNKLGMIPIIYKLVQKGLTIDYLYDLEEKCHVDIITHLVNDNQLDKDTSQSK